MSTTRRNRLLAGRLRGPRTSGALLLCLLSLWGCSRPQPVVRIVRLTPPAVLLARHELPRWQGGTNADLVAYVMALRAALDSANLDKASLQKWVDDGRKEDTP